MLRKRGFYLTKLSISLLLLLAISSCPATAQMVGCLDCMGGFDDGNLWGLLDHDGYLLEEGDWVYPVGAGPDGEIDPPDIYGQPTGDDSLCNHVEAHIGDDGCFFIGATTWSHTLHPTVGDRIYCRIFDDSKDR